MMGIKVKTFILDFSKEEEDRAKECRKHNDTIDYLKNKNIYFRRMEYSEPGKFTVTVIIWKEEAISK